MMLRQGKRASFDHHEQLSSPAGIKRKPLSKPSLTSPTLNKKKKLLEVILKIPPKNNISSANSNPNNPFPTPSPCPCPSPSPSPRPLSSSSPPSSPPSPLHHHHHLQQHQLHHHQQLLLQQQHYQKQKLLQQQKQQLTTELQFKLQQQHLQQLQLQQHHPQLLEQFKQQLHQQQIHPAPDLRALQQQQQHEEEQRNLTGLKLQHEPQANPNSLRSPQEEERRKPNGARLQQEPHEKPESLRSLQEEPENPTNLRRRGRTQENLRNAPQDERKTLKRCRLQGEERTNQANFNGVQMRGDEQQNPKAFCSPRQEQSNPRALENLMQEDQPNTKRLKLLEQHQEENYHIHHSLRSPYSQHFKLTSLTSVNEAPQIPNPGLHGLPQTSKPSSLRAPSPNGLLPPPLLFPLSSISPIWDAGNSSKAMGHSQPLSSTAHQALDSQKLQQQTLLEPVAWHGLSSSRSPVQKPVSEGKGPRDPAVTGPSKLMAFTEGSANAPVPSRKVLRGVLEKLQKKDRFGVFSEPVDPKQVPDYYDVIKEPMDFGTMRKRITAGYYTSLELFERDIFKICSNAMRFNAVGTVYHRQARAIKVSADRVLEVLKTSSTAVYMANEAPLRHKTGEPSAKKSHKKRLNAKAWADSGDYVSEAMLTAGGCADGRASTSDRADISGYNVDWQAGSVHTPTKVKADYKEDTSGCLSRSLGLIDGRRPQVIEESRRNSYRPTSMPGSGSLVTPLASGPLQFVPAAYQLDFSYARSLARFAADLGPVVWKVATEKIQRALPQGVPFGPGWVGEREGLGRFFAPLNKSQAPLHSDVQGKEANMSNETKPLTISDAQRVRKTSMGGDSSGAVDSNGLSSNLEQHASISVASERAIQDSFGAYHRYNIQPHQQSEMSHFSQSCTQRASDERSREEIEGHLPNLGSDLGTVAGQTTGETNGKGYAESLCDDIDCENPKSSLRRTKRVSGAPAVSATSVVPVSAGTTRVIEDGKLQYFQTSGLAEVSGVQVDSQHPGNQHKNMHLGPLQNGQLNDSHLTLGSHQRQQDGIDTSRHGNFKLVPHVPQQELSRDVQSSVQLQMWMQLRGYSAEAVSQHGGALDYRDPKLKQGLGVFVPESQSQAPQEGSNVTSASPDLYGTPPFRQSRCEKFNASELQPSDLALQL